MLNEQELAQTKQIVEAVMEAALPTALKLVAASRENTPTLAQGNLLVSEPVPLAVVEGEPFISTHQTMRMKAWLVAYGRAMTQSKLMLMNVDDVASACAVVADKSLAEFDARWPAP